MCCPPKVMGMEFAPQVQQIHEEALGTQVLLGPLPENRSRKLTSGRGRRGGDGTIFPYCTLLQLKAGDLKLLKCL